jgi:hypothetical protein
MADAKPGRRTKERPACPECHAKDTVPIVYGFPSYDTFEAADRGEVAIGGCVIEADNPRWGCPACEHRW